MFLKNYLLIKLITNQDLNQNLINLNNYTY